MRKVFGSVFLVTTMLAAIVGVGIAWTSSATGSATASAGSLSVALDSSNSGYGPTANQVYPSGLWTNVFEGQIKNNTPANPGIAVSITGGSVAVTGTSNGGCNWSTISGNLDVTGPGPIAAGGAIGGQWFAQLNMSGAANDSCQGNTISYNVIVNVTT